MRRWFLFVVAALLCAPFARAQFTTVSAQVKDSNGNLYSACRGDAVFVPNPSGLTQPLLGGSVFPTDVVIAQCDSSANFTLNLADVAQVTPSGGTWKFNLRASDGTHGFSYTAPICPNAGCVTGSSLNITSAIQTVAPLLSPLSNPLLNCTPTTLVFSATETFDASSFCLFQLTLTGNVTSSTIINPVSGRVIQFEITQNGTGGNTFAWPASVLSPPAVCSAANCTSRIELRYNGTNWVNPSDTVGAFNPTKNWNLVDPSGVPGADCGAKVLNAIATYGTPITLMINNACGLGTGAAPWTAISSSAAGVVMVFVEYGLYTHSGITLNGPNSGISSLFPCSQSIGNAQNCPVVLKLGNSLNLPAAVTLGGTQDFIERVIVDANKANNPTGGVGVLINLANKAQLDNMSVQNAPSHNILWKSTLSGKESCCGAMKNVMSIGANGSAVYGLNTPDINLGGGSQLENPGITATVNTTNTTITATSGSWTTDSSLVGAMVRVNNATTCKILANPSTTTLTVSTTQCWNSFSGVAGGLGTQNGVPLSMGNSLELSDSATWRLSQVDFGGAQMDCVLIYGTAAGQRSNTLMLNGGGVQCGNQVQNGVEVIGSGTGGSDQGTITSGSNMLSNIDFLGSVNTTPTATWSQIALIDGGNNEIIGNIFGSSTAPHQMKCSISVGESSSGRSGFNTVNPDTANSLFSNGNIPVCDNTTNGGLGMIVPTRGNGGVGATFTIQDITPGATAPNWSFRVLGTSGNNNLQFLNNAFSVPVQINSNGQIQMLSNGGGTLIAEGGAPGAGTGQDICYGDSTAHATKCSYNNGSFSQVMRYLDPTFTLKKGSGAGNYTNATTSYTVADSTNLCYTVTIPTGFKLGISASGALSTATAAVVAQAALTDNAACSTANAGILVETAPIQGAGIGIADAFALNWVITGDGASHNIALQFKTSNAADTASLINSSATITPTMKFELMPSN